MIRRIFLLALAAMALACAQAIPLQAQQQAEPRIAFVVGNAAYGAGPIANALNDAGLVAEALRSIGFEIVEGGDLGQPDFIQSYREFLGKVEAAGPDTLAFVYFSGYALSFEGENFLLGVDAQLARESDIPIQGIRLSDLMRPLADAPARAKVMMIDAARPLPFKPPGRGLATGLASVEPPQGMLIAYSSAPGTVAPDRPGEYGAYATAIAEMLRAPGTDIDNAFTHIRSRTHLSTEGQQTPWHLSAIGEQLELVPATASASAAVAAPPPPRQARPMREIGADEAYSLAIEMDTLDGYVQFVEAYPGHPYTERVWAMIRARREAMAWMRALQTDTPRAYWTYLRRYPNGMYAYDAERRLRRLRMGFAPPQGFIPMEFDDVPVALVDEPREYREVYRVGPPPPRILYAAAIPAFIAAIVMSSRRDGPRDDWRRDGRRGDGGGGGRDGRDGRWGGGGRRGAGALPATLAAIPPVQGVTAAPRREGPPPGASRPGGYVPRGGFAGRPPGGSGGAAPSGTPGTAIAPSTVTPSPAPGAGRPPGSGLRPGSWPPPSGAPQTAPGAVTTTTPPGAAPGPGRPGRPGWTPGGPPAGGPPPSAAVTPPGTATPGTSPPGAPQTAPGAVTTTTPPGVSPGPGRPGRPGFTPGGAPAGGPPPGAAVTPPGTATPGTPPPGTRPDGRDRRPPGWPPSGSAGRPPSGAPGTAVAPSTVSPTAPSPTTAAPSAPPPGARPDWRDRRPPPGSGQPPAVIGRTPPPGAPPPQAVRPPPPSSPPPQVVRPPQPSPPPPVIARPTPPQQPVARPAPPPPVVRAPPPPPVQRAAPPPPPPRQAAPAPPPPRPAAPPPRPAPAPAAAPKCPPGKSFVNGACK